MDKLPSKAWICPVCGYIHYGPEPPEECPVCGTEKGLFEPYTEPEAVLPTTGAAIKVVIAGAGIAGVSAAEALRKASPQAEITLISNEALFPYYRMNLTRYLAGEVGIDQLDLHPQSWYADNRITLLTGCELRRIDLAKKELTLQDDRRIAFDKLILTIGAYPFLPPFPGASLRNVCTVRTRKDIDFLLEVCPECETCVCIGGGLLGLETAGALARRGLDVTVLENQAWLLPRQLNQAAGKLFQQRIKPLGITVRTQARTREITGSDKVSSVLLEDGATIPADLVVISAGIRSNVDLARAAGLAVNQGVMVDDNMQTSHPDVFAAGDVAEHNGTIYGIWPPAQFQGAIAGMNAAGQAAEFAGIPRSNTLKVLGYDLFSIGQINAAGADDQVIDAEWDNQYACFVFHAAQMVGSILMGEISLSNKVKAAIENHIDFSTLLNKKPGAKDIESFLLTLNN